MNKNLIRFMGLLLIYFAGAVYIGLSLQSVELLKENSIVIYYILIILVSFTVYFVSKTRGFFSRKKTKSNNRKNNTFCRSITYSEIISEAKGKIHVNKETNRNLDYINALLSTSDIIADTYIKQGYTIIYDQI